MQIEPTITELCELRERLGKRDVSFPASITCHGPGYWTVQVSDVGAWFGKSHEDALDAAKGGLLNMLNNRGK